MQADGVSVNGLDDVEFKVKAHEHETYMDGIMKTPLDQSVHDSAKSARVIRTASGSLDPLVSLCLTVIVFTPASLHPGMP